MSARLLLLFIIVQLVLAPVQTSASTLADTREDLCYQISLGPWDDVARLHLVLKEMEPGRYLAEFSGAAQGMWRLLSRWLPERYSTEMVLRERRLVPLVYREEFMDQGQHIFKEYRFDYEHQRLTLWRQVDRNALVKEWEVPLNGPVYDILSLVYNVRLGTFGALSGGTNLRVAVLPTPQPQELVFRIGEATDQGRKVMLNFRSPDSNSESHYFITLNSQGVPTLAWTRITLFGKLAGRLLNPGGIRQEWLPTVALHK
jgi:hypothetical protein